MFAILISVLIPSISIALTILVKDEYSRMVISDVSSPLYNLLATIALIMAAIQTRKISKRLSWGWGILAIAQFSFTLGDTIWAVLELGLKVSPFPSFADEPYLLYYPLFFLGIFLFPSKRFSPVEWIKRTLDTSIIMVVAILGYWIFLIGPLMRVNHGMSFVEKFLSVAYPAGDLILLFALLVIIYYRSEKINVGSMWILALGLVTMIVTDSIYNYQSLLGTYASGAILDFGWLFSYVLIALAGIFQTLSAQIYQEGDAVPDKNLVTRGIISHAVSFMPYLWVIAAYILLLNFHNSDLPINSSMLLFGIGCIIGLVITRQIIVLQENIQLLSNLRMVLEQVNQQASELDKSNTNLRQEITERNRVEAQLAHDALHDGLTGLANRILFMDRLGHAFEINKRELEFNYSILFLDLDNFKAINDGVGHSVGDKVLIEVGLRLKKCMRALDTVARFWGDEFVVLLENTTENNAAMSVAKRILTELERPFNLIGNEVQITCSIGIVQGITGYTNPEDVLRDVDIAMHRAKEKGKARIELFSLDMRTSALYMLEIESDLRRAIANGEFILNYQPIYSLEHNHIVGLEALVRWNHPIRGLLMPSEFINVAEKSGLIIPLGDWVLSEACSQLRKWHLECPGLGDLSVNVNISAKQIIQKDLVEKVKETLRLTGLDPKKLKLEITENAYIENQVVLNDFLSDLLKIGVAFMIDDFGAGYSSLGYLKNIPVNTIKIDKSFVDGILEGGKDFEIIKTIIAMAQGMGMDTIAEGIENGEQLIKLKSINCVYGQGFFLSEPLDVINTENILKTSSLRI